jgi:hypothetical protein
MLPGSYDVFESTGFSTFCILLENETKWKSRSVGLGKLAFEAKSRSIHFTVSTDYRRLSYTSQYSLGLCVCVHRIVCYDDIVEVVEVHPQQ